MLEKLLALLMPQQIKDRLAALEAWKAQVEAVCGGTEQWH